jgi:cytochrome c oxidase subunit 4
MSAITEAHHVEAPEHRDHPSDFMYVKVALLLGVLTALEVSTYFFHLSTPQLVVVLIPMMVIKFGVVVAYFMHLKFDSHLFRKVFVAGLVLAVGVYCAALTTFQFWAPSYPASKP